jgi:hypothetical protein
LRARWIGGQAGAGDWFLRANTLPRKGSTMRSPITALLAPKDRCAPKGKAKAPPSARRVLARLLGAGASLAVLLGAQGLGSMQGSIEAWQSSQGFDLERQMQAVASCGHESEAALLASNPVGGRVAMALAKIASPADDLAADRFLRDKAIASGRCVAAKMADGALGEPSPLLVVAVAAQLSGAQTIQARLGAAAPMSDADALWVKERLAQAQKMADIGFRREIERDEIWRAKAGKMCEGPLGAARCAPMAMMSLGAGKSWREAIGDPLALFDHESLAIQTTAAADRALWRAQHPAEEAAQNARRLALLDAPASASAPAKDSAWAAVEAQDPAPSRASLEAARAAQAKRIAADLAKQPPSLSE